VVRGHSPAIIHQPESAIASPSGGRRFVLASSTATFSEWKGSDVRRDDLLNSDLLSEIVLLGSAMLLVATLVAIVVMAFTPAALQV
jgi:hypothetical protein